MTDWWTEFFDVRYLSLWGPTLEGKDGEAEARQVTQLAGVVPPGRILDVPCGFGRVSKPLAELGFQVVGVDLSPDMIAEGRRRCDGLDVELIEGDMRELPVEGTFDAILCLFSSIGYSGDPDDDLQFFRAARRHLGDGAPLVIDTRHRDFIAAHLMRRDWLDIDGGPLVTERRMDWVTGLGGEVVRWFENGEWWERSFELYHYTATELGRLLRDAGFTHLAFFGDLDGRPLSPDTRLVVVARQGAGERSDPRGGVRGVE
jgi:SAM-dependent methyltransferase